MSNDYHTYVVSGLDLSLRSQSLARLCNEPQIHNCGRHVQRFREEREGAFYAVHAVGS